MKKSIRNWLLKLPPLLSVWLFAASGSHGQQAPLPELPVYFRANRSVVDPDYMGNRLALSRMSSVFTPENSPYIVSLRIDGYASPEGSSAVNERLSWERAEALKRYILTYHPTVPPSKVVSVGMGVNWAELRRLVDADLRTPRRAEVLYIIDHVHAHIDAVSNVSRKKSLMDLGTHPWEYMLRNHFPLLRGTLTVVIQPDTPAGVVASMKQALTGEPHAVYVDLPADPPAEAPRGADTVYVERAPVRQTPVFRVVPNQAGEGRQPLFALKTNLLFDLGTALNLEAEIPIGRGWSLAGEYVFPWWLSESRQIALQTLSGTAEGRRWFGDREGRAPLTGWFAGVYGGLGYYDLEWKDKGYQGEFFHAGLSGGYAHSIGWSGNWRMEYSIGLGVLQTKYRAYEPVFGIDEQWHLIRQKDGRRTWFGPTRAKVSLVWMLNHGYKKGGTQ